MARSFGPFDTNPMYDVVNRRMQRAFNAATGFVRSGQGAVTAGTGAQLVIAAYPDGALIDGLYVENPTTEAVALTTNTGSANPRIDRLVLRLDMGAKTIAPVQIVGTPAASPTPPPLVNTGTVVDMPLCRYTMPGSGSAQNPGSIVDERTYASSVPASGKMWRTAGASGAIGTLTPLRCGMEASRLAGGFAFDDATNMLTVPADGFYDLGACLYWFGTGTWSATGWIERTRSGASLPVVTAATLNKGSDNDTRQYFGNRLPLQAGDTLCLVVYAYTAGAQYYGNGEVNTSWLSATYAGPLNGASPV